jgi:2-methylcitrate dehydratase PrpD
VYAAERCGAWAEAQRGKPLAPEVLHHAKRAVIDWHAALYPGAVVPPATLLEQALADELNHGEAFLALGKRATTPFTGTASTTPALRPLRQRWRWPIRIPAMEFHS